MATAITAAPAAERTPLLQNRWLILIAGIVCMIAIANYQYGWTLFVTPLSKKFGVSNAPIQIAFSLFVLLETWLVPFEGWLVDRFGPRNLVMLGGAVAGVGWWFSGAAQDLTQLYLAYALCGVGAGAVYGTCAGNAIKWFPDRRGLAAGLTAAGFGAGAALTVLPIASMVGSAGYAATFQQWGLIQGAVVLVFALLLKAPPKNWLPRTWTLEAKATEVKKRQTAHDLTPGQMASTKQFWVLYLMMIFVATGGLMATAQIGPMATYFKVDALPVDFLFIQMTALAFALSLNNVVNGVCRPFWGWISDHIGREKTMSVAFGLEGTAILLLILSLQLFHNGWLFIILSGLSFFGYGEIFSLFPATVGDFFGRKYATTNYGFLYTAKGTSSVFVPIGSALAAGAAFDFRADILMLIGALLVFFTLYLGPVALRLPLGRAARTVLFTVAGAFILVGLALTITNFATPFSAKWTVPNIGWGGVFGIAVATDWLSAILAYRILRRLAVPAGGERASVETAQPVAVPAGAE